MTAVVYKTAEERREARAKMIALVEAKKKEALERMNNSKEQ